MIVIYAWHVSGLTINDDCPTIDSWINDYCTSQNLPPPKKKKQPQNKPRCDNLLPPTPVRVHTVLSSLCAIQESKRLL